MKKLSKFVLIFCFTDALTLSIGFINNKDLNNAEAFKSTEQPKVEDGDQYLFVTAEVQNMVEDSIALSGFVQQEDGSVVFFEKIK